MNLAVRLFIFPSQHPRFESALLHFNLFGFPRRESRLQNHLLCAQRHLRGPSRNCEDTEERSGHRGGRRRRTSARRPPYKPFFRQPSHPLTSRSPIRAPLFLPMPTSVSGAVCGVMVYSSLAFSVNNQVTLETQTLKHYSLNATPFHPIKTPKP